MSTQERVIACGPVACHDYYHGSLKPWAWAFFKLDLTVAVFPPHTHTHTIPALQQQTSRLHTHTSHLQVSTSVCFCTSARVYECLNLMARRPRRARASVTPRPPAADESYQTRSLDEYLFALPVSLLWLTEAMCCPELFTGNI